jgi:amidophosphoribosyltransferase
MSYINQDRFIDHCAVFGTYNLKESIYSTILGLHALQHRGQEASGVFYFQESGLFSFKKGIGKVSEVYAGFDHEKIGNPRVTNGHNRYSTFGGSEEKNIQPLYAQINKDNISISHNGNITNAHYLKQNLLEDGCIFQSDMDTEVILHLIAKSKETNIIEKIQDALRKVEGAYSLIITYNDEIIAIRDPNGIRPLVLGKKDNGFVLSSETCGLDIINATFEREIDPGEILLINDKGIKSFSIANKVNKTFCIFEYIYFARPDSNFLNQNVYEARINIGKQLYLENKKNNSDIVIPVPDSGLASAIGYSEASGIPFQLGIIRNHYVGRSFIQPKQELRDLAVKMKHNVNLKLLQGKSITLIDDSIVRGTTSKKIVSLLKNAGVKKIHFKVASPAIIGSCYYGVDTPNEDNLIANIKNLEEIKDYLEVDTLQYLSLEGLYKAVNGNQGYCDACFTKKYPVPLIDQTLKKQQKEQIKLV